MAYGKVDALLGIVFGDEGKGKVVDYFTPQYDVVARFAGGPNAGHTIIFDGKKFVLRSIPSGIFDPDKVNIIGTPLTIILSEGNIFIFTFCFNINIRGISWLVVTRKNRFNFTFYTTNFFTYINIKTFHNNWFSSKSW